MSSYYSDDESVDIRVKRYSRAPSPGPRQPSPHYIQTVTRERPRSGYYQSGPVYLNPERTVVTTRSRSRERRSSPPSSQPAPVAPVVIHNKIINEQSSDDDDSYYYSSDGSSRHRHHRSSSRRRRPRERSRSRHSPTSSSGQLVLDAARDQWELERAKRELEQLRLAQSREREERRLDKQYREEAELQRAKRELDEIKRRERLEQEEKRIRKEIELKKLEEERRAAEEKARREKEAEEAVARYKAQEAERVAKEKAEKERAEKEYQRRLREDLLQAGVDEKDIEAIIKKEKIKRDDDEKRRLQEMELSRPTYTRMSLKHLDIETLLYFKIDFEYDQDQPGYVIIKRWVPEWEQDMLWEHTRKIRIVQKKEKSDHQVVLTIDEGKKHRHRHKEDDQFMWVHKKTERKRSKSPSLLMYLAGARPA